MNVIHHISFDINNPVISHFKELEISLRGSGLANFDIGENDSKWTDVQKIIAQHPKGILDFQFVTKFTHTEMNNAKYFTVFPKWHFEYPQPEDDFGYLMTTYDIAKNCQKCGMELLQIKPFSLKNIPKWGKRNIVQLNWVFDEYFVSGALKIKLDEKNSGLKFKPVLKYNTDTVLNDIFQLDITKTIELDMSNIIEYQICNICKKNKYLPHTRGFYPKPVQHDFKIAHSTQYFGSGTSASRAVLINRNTYNLFNEIGVNGVSYTPCCYES